MHLRKVNHQRICSCCPISSLIRIKKPYQQAILATLARKRGNSQIDSPPPHRRFAPAGATHAHCPSALTARCACALNGAVVRGVHRKSYLVHRQTHFLMRLPIPELRGKKAIAAGGLRTEVIGNLQNSLVHIFIPEQTFQVGSLPKKRTRGVQYSPARCSCRQAYVSSPCQIARITHQYIVAQKSIDSLLPHKSYTPTHGRGINCAVAIPKLMSKSC